MQKHMKTYISTLTIYHHFAKYAKDTLPRVKRFSEVRSNNIYYYCVNNDERIASINYYCNNMWSTKDITGIFMSPSHLGQA